MNAPGNRHDERRRYPRCQAPVLVRCHVVSEPDIHVQSVSRDVALGGIRFPVAEQLRSGAVLEMMLEVSPEQTPIHAQGEVRWLREFSRIGRPQYEVGVEFTELSDMDQRRLQAFCDRWFASGIPA